MAEYVSLHAGSMGGLSRRASERGGARSTFCGLNAVIQGKPSRSCSLIETSMIFRREMTGMGQKKCSRQTFATHCTTVCKHYCKEPG